MRLRLLPRYLLTFGLFSGLFTFLQVEVLSFSKVFLVGYRYPIFLRRGTTDVKTFREIFLFGDYKYDFEAPKVIVDGGANIGLASVYFNKRYKDALIYAIEPDQSNFLTLCSNVASLPMVTCIHSALWHQDTFLKIMDKNENAWAFTVDECSEDEPGSFVALSITSLMKKYSIERIDVLKLDIEGAERELFSQNVDSWITRTKYIFIELHDWLKKDSSKSVFKTISQYNFSTSVVNGMLLLTNLEIE